MEKIKLYVFWLLTLLSPMKTILFTIVFLIVVDFITGAYASLKNNIPISGERIGNTISKFFIYNLVIISAFLLEKFIVNEVPFQRIITGFIAIAEVKSILENFNKIYGTNPFKALVQFIKRKSLKNLEETIDVLVNEQEPKHKIQKK